MTINFKANTSFSEVLRTIASIPRIVSEFDIKIEGYDNLTYSVKPNWEDDYDESTHQHDWGWSDCYVNGRLTTMRSLAEDITATAETDPQIIADMEAQAEYQYDFIPEFV